MYKVTLYSGGDSLRSGLQGTVAKTTRSASRDYDQITPRQASRGGECPINSQPCPATAENDQVFTLCFGKTA